MKSVFDILNNNNTYLRSSAVLSEVYTYPCHFSGTGISRYSAGNPDTDWNILSLPHRVFLQTRIMVQTTQCRVINLG